MHADFYPETDGMNYCFKWVKKLPRPRKERRKHVGRALWTEDEGKIYITCPFCGAINSLEGFGVDDSGRGWPCIYCTGCKRKFWMHLHDWTSKCSKKARKKHKCL